MAGDALDGMRAAFEAGEAVVVRAEVSSGEVDCYAEGKEEMDEARRRLELCSAMSWEGGVIEIGDVKVESRTCALGIQVEEVCTDRREVRICSTARRKVERSQAKKDLHSRK